MNIWDEELLKPQAEYPCLEFVRFVKRHPRFKTFLDIGCGSGGAHLDFLLDHDLEPTGLDSSPAAWPDVLGDVQDPDTWDRLGTFDCILDHNTLCHVERPPFDKIHDALNPGGIFFMVAPTEDTCIRDELRSRSFVRFTSEVEIREMLEMFSMIRVGYSEYTDHRHGGQVKSYVVEATK